MKDAVVSARVEADVKEEAEAILQSMGIPVSVLINALYRQIIYTNSIPFAIAGPQRPRTLEEMTKEELDARLQRGYEQSLRGDVISLDEAAEQLGVKVSVKQ